MRSAMPVVWVCCLSSSARYAYEQGECDSQHPFNAALVRSNQALFSGQSVDANDKARHS